MLVGQALGTDPIRDQSLVVACIHLQRHHHALAHLRMRAQTRFDLAQLDAETTDLDLVIVASEKFDVAVGTPAPQITSAVHPCRRIGAKWIGEEAFGGQVVTVQISTRHTVAADIQLAHHPDRHRRTMSIEDVGARVGDRTTNRTTATPVHIRYPERPPRYMHGGFCDPVHIDQMRRKVALMLEPRLQRPYIQCLATEDDQPQTMFQTAVTLRRNQRLKSTRRLV